MIQTPKQSADKDNLNAFIRTRRNGKRRNRNFGLLNAETTAYFETDKQNLAREIKQENGSKEAVFFKWRLFSYYVIEDFFFYLAEQNLSTRLVDITTDMIRSFLNRPRSITQYKPTKQSHIPGQLAQRAQERERVELKAFFHRAEQHRVIPLNPYAPLIKMISQLAPTNLSSRTLTDWHNFEKYLERLVNYNRLSPKTAARYKIFFRILLHDVEKRHEDDSEWPTELDDLFADPKWLFDWLNNLENRSIAAKGPELAQESAYIYLLTVRHIWLFLKSQRRAAADFYDALRNMFRLDDSPYIILPGRAAKVIPALSEAEQEAIWASIERLSTSLTLQLRDTALFVTAIETTMRVESLQSMRLENRKELEPNVYVWSVKAKRDSKKDSGSQARLGEDKAEWRDWYISPHALSVIDKYLKATNRTWKSRGPLWLTDEGKPLLKGSLQTAITTWLKIAKCRFTRPHILRHTGIDRLINKFNKPIPTVQAISQHSDPTILINVYAKRAIVDAFRAVNQVYPDNTLEERNCQELLVSVGTHLNEISAGISRRKQDKRTFSHQHAEELLTSLRQETTRLVNFLGLTASADVVALSKEDYQHLSDTLQAAGLSFEQILGHPLKTPRQTGIKRPGRNPNSLFSS